MRTVKEIIAQQKKEMSRQEYRLLIKMLKNPKACKMPKKRRV